MGEERAFNALGGLNAGISYPTQGWQADTVTKKGAQGGSIFPRP